MRRPTCLTFNAVSCICDCEKMRYVRGITSDEKFMKWSRFARHQCVVQRLQLMCACPPAVTVAHALKHTIARVVRGAKRATYKRVSFKPAAAGG